MIDKIVKDLAKMVEKLRHHHEEQTNEANEHHQKSVVAFANAGRAKRIADNIDELLDKNPHG